MHNTDNLPLQMGKLNSPQNPQETAKKEAQAEQNIHNKCNAINQSLKRGGYTPIDLVVYPQFATMLDINQLMIVVEDLVANKKGKIMHQTSAMQMRKHEYSVRENTNENEWISKCAKLEWKLSILEDINAKLEEDIARLQKKSGDPGVIAKCCSILEIPSMDKMPECLTKVKKVLVAAQNMEVFIKQIHSIAEKCNSVDVIYTLNKWKTLDLKMRSFVDGIESLCQQPVGTSMLSYIEKLVYYERKVAPYITVN